MKWCSNWCFGNCRIPAVGFPALVHGNHRPSHSAAAQTVAAGNPRSSTTGKRRRRKSEKSDLQKDGK